MEARKLIREDDEFPSNSNKDKSEVAKPVTQEKRVDRIVTGTVIRQKKTFGQKASQVFFGDDTRTVMDYVVHDVLIPAMKTTLSDMVGGGIEMLLFGERRSSPGTSRLYRDRSKSYVPYNRLSRGEEENRSVSRNIRSTHDFDQITIESRGEAEDVLSHLVDLIEDYGVASVADYYELLGVDSHFTDQKFGWTNVRDAYVERIRNGYSIRLPRPREI